MKDHPAEFVGKWLKGWFLKWKLGRHPMRCGLRINWYMDGVPFRSFTTRKIRSANIRVAESNSSKLSGDTDNTHIIVVAIYYSAERYPRALYGMVGLESVSSFVGCGLLGERGSRWRLGWVSLTISCIFLWGLGFRTWEGGLFVGLRIGSFSPLYSWD